MKSRNLYAGLAIFGFFLVAFFATQNIVALPDGTTLMVYDTTDTIKIDFDLNLHERIFQLDAIVTLILYSTCDSLLFSHIME
ncbi:MAG: hypothetical protein ACXAEE_03950 [Candidatus Thorarchaeota archaeon]